MHPTYPTGPFITDMLAARALGVDNRTDLGQLLAVFARGRDVAEARAQFLETRDLPGIDPEVRAQHERIAADLEQHVMAAASRGLLRAF